MAICGGKSRPGAAFSRILKPYLFSRESDGNPAPFQRRSVFRALSAVDRDYLITYPRDACEIEYQLPPEPSGQARSYFARSHGYYVEWLRHEWVTAEDGSVRSGTVNATSADMSRMAARWLDRKTDFEREFFGTALLALKEEQP